MQTIYTIVFSLGRHSGFSRDVPNVTLIGVDIWNWGYQNRKKWELFNIFAQYTDKFFTPVD